MSRDPTVTYKTGSTSLFASYTFETTMDAFAKLQPHQCKFLSEAKKCPIDKLTYSLHHALNSPSCMTDIHTELHWSDRGWFTRCDHLANAIFHQVLKKMDKEKLPEKALEAITACGSLRYRYVWLHADNETISLMERGKHWHASEEKAIEEGMQTTMELSCADCDQLLLSVESVCESSLIHRLCHCQTIFCSKLHTDLSTEYESSDSRDSYQIDGHTAHRAPYKVEVSPEKKLYLFHIQGSNGWFVSPVKNTEVSFKHELMKRM